MEQVNIKYRYIPVYHSTCTCVYDVYDIFLQNKVTCCVVYTLCIFFIQSTYVYSMCTQYWPTGNRMATLIKPKLCNRS